jgi:hypothetical protein
MFREPEATPRGQAELAERVNDSVSQNINLLR